MVRDFWEGLSGDVRYNLNNRRHWCPVSELYASNDVLLEYLYQGWIPDNRVMTETYHLGGHRLSVIYSFMLWRHDNHLHLPGLANPITIRVVNKYFLTTTEAVGSSERWCLPIAEEVHVAQPYRN